ncbi:MAG: SRPBCC family protein [Thermoleophilia bacterium]
MRVESEFTIPRPPAEAYALLLDLDRVAPCFPGAELGGEAPEGGRAVTVTVRLGPMRLSYVGRVDIGERDEAALTAVLSGSARDARGAGSATAAIHMAVHPDPAGSRVTAAADIELTGRAAHMGAGVIEDVSRRLVGEMASCLQAGLAEPADERRGDGPSATVPLPAATPPLDGGRLALQMARGRLQDPRVAAAAGAVGALLLRAVLRMLRGGSSRA